MSDEDKLTTYTRMMTLKTLLEIQEVHALGLATTPDFVDAVAKEGVGEGAAKQRLRSVFEEGYIRRVLRGAYLVTPEGLQRLENAGMEGFDDS